MARPSDKSDMSDIKSKNSSTSGTPGHNSQKAQGVSRKLTLDLDQSGHGGAKPKNVKNQAGNNQACNNQAGNIQAARKNDARPEDHISLRGRDVKKTPTNNKSDEKHTEVKASPSDSKSNPDVTRSGVQSGRTSAKVEIDKASPTHTQAEPIIDAEGGEELTGPPKWIFDLSSDEFRARIWDAIENIQRSQMVQFSALSKMTADNKHRMDAMLNLHEEESNDTRHLVSDLRSLSDGLNHLESVVRSMQGSVNALKRLDLTPIKTSLQEVQDKNTTFERKIHDIIKDHSQLKQKMSDLVNRFDDLEKEQLASGGPGSNTNPKFAEETNGLNVSFGDTSPNTDYCENYPDSWQLDDQAYYVPQHARDNSQNCTRGRASHRAARHGTIRRRETSGNMHRGHYGPRGDFNNHNVDENNFGQNGQTSGNMHRAYNGPRGDFNNVEENNFVDRRGKGMGHSNLAADLPKLERYNGVDVEWQDFYEQFEVYAAIKGWGENVDIFRMYLKGKALEFYNRQSRATKSSYTETIRVLEERFGTKGPIEAQQAAFSSMRQNDDEEIQDFADRVRKTARLAFRDLSDAEDYVEREMIKAFLKGLSNEELSLFGFGQTFTCLDRCVEKILVFKENKRTRALHKEVRFVNVPKETNSDDLHIRATQANFNKGGPTTNLSPGIAATLKQVAEQCKSVAESLAELKRPALNQEQLNESIRSSLERLLQKESGTSGANRSRSPAPPRSSRSPSRDRNGNCYHCNLPGHFKRDCPEIAKKPLNSHERI